MAYQLAGVDVLMPTIPLSDKSSSRLPVARQLLTFDWGRARHIRDPDTGGFGILLIRCFDMRERLYTISV